MNEPYPQPPGYPPQPGYPPPLRRQGMGCFAKGCLVVVVVFLLLGALAAGFSWYTYQGIRPFIATQPVPIRTYPATQEQYTALMERIQKFWVPSDANQTPTLKLSADDVNTYIACAPEASEARGKAYVSIVNDLLVVETSIPMPEKNNSSRQGSSYFVGKITFALSFEGGDFNFDLRKLETVDGKPAPGLVNALIHNPDFMRGFNHSFTRSFNDGFRKQVNRNPNLSTVLDRIHTVTIQHDQIVITATSGPLTPPR